MEGFRFSGFLADERLGRGDGEEVPVMEKLGCVPSSGGSVVVEW